MNGDFCDVDFVCFVGVFEYLLLFVKSGFVIRSFVGARVGFCIMLSSISSRVLVLFELLAAPLPVNLVYLVFGFEPFSFS